MLVIKTTWSDLVSLLLFAQKEISIVMPAIHEEWVDIIYANPNRFNLKIRICIDNAEEPIRKGYGSVSAVEKLKQLNAEIKQCPGLKIGLVRTDHEAILLFIESRILSGDPEGFNSILLDGDNSQKLIDQFFPSLLEVGSKTNEQISLPLQENKWTEAKTALQNNPPDQPDLKRKVSTYTTLFQYAELRFEGSKLANKTISIPPDALPFKDADLKKRMKTKFNLFESDVLDKWNNLGAFREEFEKLKKDYLVACSLKYGKGILRKEKKTDFVKSLEELQTKLTTLSAELINLVQSEINKAEDTLEKELQSFFENNSSQEFDNLDNDNRKRAITKKIRYILSKTKIPSAEDLISEMNLDCLYSEFTWEDLKDEKFIEWFKEKNLINGDEGSKLANITEAYKIKL